MALISHTPSVNSYRWIASPGALWQTFVTPSGIDRIGYVDIPVTRVGSVAGNATVYIFATSGGIPTGSALGSATYNANSITTSLGNYYRFDFSSDISVASNRVYAIVFNGGSTSASNFIGWNYYSTGSPYYNFINTYGSGTGGYKYSGGGWLTYPGDYPFKVYVYQSATQPSVTSVGTDNIDSTSAEVDGNVTSDGGSTVLERGVCYSKTDSTPTTANNKKTTSGTTGTFTVDLTGLSPGQHYYAKPYARNAIGTAYGSLIEFDTDTVAPSIYTQGVTEIKAESAKVSANVTSNGGEQVTARGVCYDTSTGPDTGDSTVSAGTGIGEFTIEMTGLTPADEYFVRPYATNSEGTTYGDEVSFTALDTIDKWGQSITSTATGVLSQVDLYLKLLYGTSGTVKVSIYDDDSGPDTKLGSLAPITITNTDYEWIAIPANIDITDTDVYWIVLEDPYVIGSYHIAWGANSSGGYATGAVNYTKSSAPTSWINTSYASHDSCFKAYYQPTFTPDFDVTIKGRNRYLS